MMFTMRAVLLSLVSVFVLAILQGSGVGGAVVKRSSTADFDDHVGRWVQEKSRQVGRKVSWWDSYGKHQHLAERPQYHRFQVSAHTGPMRYQTEFLDETDKPQQVYSKWFCNYQSKQPITTTISRELKRRARFTWMQENGLKIGVELSMKATIPGIMDIGASFSTQLDFRGRNTEVKEETETFKIQYELTVDPQTAVRADWIITEREVEVPYDVDVFVDGYTAVWYDKKVDGHWLWFYPVSHMEGGPFQSSGSGLTYHSDGTFSGTRGVNSVVEAREYPLDPSVSQIQCGDAGMAGYYSKLSPIKVTRTTMPLPSGD